MGGLFWIALAPGAAMVGFGVWGLLDHSDMTNPLESFKILIGLNLANDLVVIPVSLAISVVVGKALPAWLARPVKSGLFAASIVSFFALPAVHRWGAQSANPTVLDRDYLNGLLEILVLVGLVTAGLGARERWAMASKRHIRD